MATGSAKKEKQKRMILFALLLAFVLVIAYQFLGGGPTRPTQSSSNANRPASATSTQKRGDSQAPRPPTTREEKSAYVQTLLDDKSALNLKAIYHESGSGTVSVDRGDIFIYKPPPPPPPEKPQPQPTIQLNPPQLARNVVAGSPFNVDVIIFGSNFPPDAVVYFNGSPKQSKRVGENRLQTVLTPQEYPNQVNIQVDVKSQSDPAKWWSNVQSISIPDLQPPNILYQGRLGGGASIENLAVSNSSLERNKVVFRGQTIQGVWRLEAVDDKYIELMHTQFEVRRRIQLKNRAQ